LCIRPKSIIFEEFIFFNLNSRYLELRNESDGQSIRGSLNKDNLSNLPMVLPPKSLIKKYKKSGEILLEKIFTNRLLSKELSHLESLILSKMTKVEVEKV
jgi:restriction endonuclease S subunit